jgi:plasmid maintenance system killer protein
MFGKLPAALQEEAWEKIKQFRDERSHSLLKVHKLQGALSGWYSFSVNYHVRIIFHYLKTSPKEARLDAIGDHNIYL